MERNLSASATPETELAYRRYVASMPGRAWTLLVPLVFPLVAIANGLRRPGLFAEILSTKARLPSNVAIGVACGALGGALVRILAPSRDAASSYLDPVALASLLVVFPLVARLTFALGLQTVVGKYGIVVAAIVTGSTECATTWFLDPPAYVSEGLALPQPAIDVNRLLRAGIGPAVFAVQRATNRSLLAGLIANALIDIITTL